MTTAGATVGFVHLGPPRHGVRRYGVLLERAVSNLIEVTSIEPAGDGDLGCEPSTAASVLHLQFSDHLLSIEGFEHVVRTLRAPGSIRRDSRVVVTMHDCPGIGHDDRAIDDRRVLAYRRAAAVADAVVVCSHHERRALEATGVAAEVEVIAHLVEDRVLPDRPSGEAPRRTVCVLGFVYPGKGHDRVLDACAMVREPVELVVLGEASAGHDDLLAALVADATARHVRCRVTGWLDEDRLDEWLVDADVAIVAHHAPSASGSLATWLSAGRRPLAARTRYTCELDQLAPGTIQLFEPSDGAPALAAAIAGALRDPASTRTPAPHPSMASATIAATHLALYERLT